MITIKTLEEIKIMRQGGEILAKILNEVAKAIKPGITTKELDKLASELIFLSGAKPAFLGYEGFPAALCTSVNEEIVHALPSKRKLEEGDIIGLDLGILYPIEGRGPSGTLSPSENCLACPFGKECPSKGFPVQAPKEYLRYPTGQGFYTDMALTVPVGQIKPEAAKLIKVAKEALEIGLKEIKSGNHIGDISFAIQNYVEEQGFSVIRDLVGHGIGKKLHEDPKIPNFGQPNTGPELKVGMTLAIEPMITAGQYKIKKSKDGFGYETEDKSLASHFEHTVAVIEDGYEVLTRV